jgi:hypothetical protein
MEEEKHFPPGAEPEAPAPAPEPEAPKAPEVPADAPKDKPEEPAEPADDKAPEAEKPKEEPAKPADPPIKKPRSVYDDLKTTRQEKKDETERANAAEARAAELQALLDAKDDAKTPEEKKEAADDIEAFASQHNLDADQIRGLTDLILKKVPKADMPEGLKPDEVAAWRADRAAAARQAEDAQILATAPAIQKQLSITEPKELDAVMAEVTRLAHTPEFHDKEVEYIVWKNQAALGKMVSPKKPSFESGNSRAEADAEAPIDFSSGKVTPEQVASAARVPKQSYEIRSVKN